MIAPGAGRIWSASRLLRLDVLGLEVVVEADARGVAAALADELRQHAGIRHLGRVAGRADEHLFERAVVKVEAGRRCAFRGVDAFDQRTVLPRVAIREVGRLRAHRRAADVDAVQRHRRRGGQQRPHVARVRNRRQHLLVVVGLHARRRGVDHRRLAADRDRLLQRRDVEGDVDLGIEAERDAHAVAHDVLETGEFIGQPVFSGGHRREPVEPRFIRDGRQLADLRRAGGGHRDAGKHAALGVLHFAADAAGRACAATLGKGR